MTLDSSALIAILFAEPGYLELVDRILEADHMRVGAPTLVETALVLLGRRGTDGRRARRPDHRARHHGRAVPAPPGAALVDPVRALRTE